MTTRRPDRHRTRRLLAVAVLAAALAGCTTVDTADPEPDPSSPAPTATSPEPAPTEPTGTAEPTPTASPSPTAPAPPPAVRAHDSAADLAADLVAAETAIRDPDTPADHLPGWAHLQQAAYREVAEHPDWADAVVARAPEAIRDAVRANVHAQRELHALTTPRESLPDWRIVAAPPAQDLLGHYRAAGEEFGVDWATLAAIHLVESRMGRIRGDSTAGAQGPMQFMPATWEAYGEGDIQDPHDAIRAAARYLVAHGAPDDMRAAVWAYNHSDHYVEAILAFASVMRDDPAAYHAYYHWQVYYRLVGGDVVLEEGWTHPDGG